MGTDRDSVDKSGAEVRERQQELISSLRAAIDSLSTCVERIEALIHQVAIPTSAPSEPEVIPHAAQVSFGGGPSVIRSRENRAGERDRSLGFGETSVGYRENAGSGDRRRGFDRRVGAQERRLADERRFSRQTESQTPLGDPGMPALMAATEMAHLGYSRDEIAKRLQARWGDGAAAILREALD